MGKRKPKIKTEYVAIDDETARRFAGCCAHIMRVCKIELNDACEAQCVLKMCLTYLEEHFQTEVLVVRPVNPTEKIQ